MIKCLSTGLCMALLFFYLPVNAQEKSPVKFGKISAEDFDLSKYKFDTSVSAVVISDVGSSAFEGNNKGWFTLVFKHQMRVKILNKNGFEAANIRIPLYTAGTSEEKLNDLKAYTYNLENGNVVKTELSSAAVFKDKYSDNVMLKKFTFPAVKEGSIIEYSYTVHSDFLTNLQPWEFQGEYPRLWSEYNVSMPEFFVYVTLSQGYQPFYIKDASVHSDQFNVVIPGGALADDFVKITGAVTDYRWVMKDVPELKEEGYTTSLNNHLAKLEFQLSQHRFPNVPVRDLMGTWKSVSEKMLAYENFGLTLNKENNWLDDDMKVIVAGTTTPLEKARRIYSYVRDNFTCTDHSDVYLNSTLKTIFKNKNGSVSDINLLLIAMLHHEKIEADPVLLSTRRHGFANDFYPMMNRFNYVIADANINGTFYYLDASRPMLAFGKLPSECYNGFGRIISNNPLLIDLQADSLREAKLTTVFIFAGENGIVEGNYKTVPGYYEALRIREKIKDKGEPEYFKNIKTGYTSDIDIMQPGIDSLKMLDKPLAIHYDFKLSGLNEDIIYFNPMMAEGFKNNLFKAAERKYPVEMPYTFDETYLLTMEVPKNYIVDEVPKSTRVNFNDDEGYFEYLVNKSDDQVLLRSRVVMKRANFQPEDYNSLRDFFTYVVKKHSEQIVFKKKK
jgi:hypothetical protein